MDKSIPSISNYKLLSIVVVITIMAAFACLGFFESALTRELVDQKIFALLIKTIPQAFNRYYAFLALAGLTALATLVLDKDLFKQKRAVVLISSIVLALTLGWITMTRVLQFPICGDDSYIDFRYIRNWINGISFDYNPGERVIGFTSHIHLILLYLVGLIFKSVDIAVISQMINVVFQLLNVSLLYFFIKDLFKSRTSALVAILVYGLDPYGVQQTTFGKESHILVTTLILSIWAMYRNRNLALAWITSTMPFIRPEAVIWWFCCFIWNLKQKKTAALKYYIGPSIAVLLAILSLYYFFGTVIPHGMVGKFRMFYPMLPAFMFLNTIWMIGTDIFLPRFYLDVPGLAYALTAMITGIVTIVISFKILKPSALKWYMAAVIIYIVVFGIKNPAPFSWYHCWYSLIPIFMLAAIFPASLDLTLDKEKSLVKRSLAALLIILLIGVQCSQQFIRPEANMTASTFAWSNEFRRLIQFGYALDQMKQYPNWQNATIGAPEIGYLGYKHPGKILDFCGLLSPEVVKYGRLPDNFQAKGEVFEINPAIVKTYRPEYIITLEAFGRELLKDNFFVEHYKKVGYFENSWANSKGIFLYRYEESKSSL